MSVIEALDYKIETLEQDLKQAREEIEVLKAKLEKAKELYKKRVIEKINTNKKLLSDIKIELLDDALESFDAVLNSITLESLKGE